MFKDVCTFINTVYTTYNCDTFEVWPMHFEVSPNDNFYLIINDN